MWRASGTNFKKNNNGKTRLKNIVFDFIHSATFNTLLDSTHLLSFQMVQRHFHVKWKIDVRFICEFSFVPNDRIKSYSNFEFHRHNRNLVVLISNQALKRYESFSCCSFDTNGMINFSRLVSLLYFYPIYHWILNLQSS